MHRPLLIVLLLAGCSQADHRLDPNSLRWPPTNVDFTGTRYTLLEGDGLKRALVDHMFEHPKLTPSPPEEVVVTSPYCEIFRPEGVYARCADRVGLIHDNYTLSATQFCTRGQCRALYRSRDNQYVVMWLMAGPVEVVCVRSYVSAQPSSCPD